MVVAVLGASPVINGSNDKNYGRFTIYSHFENVIILDTDTGRIWTQFVPQGSMLATENTLSTPKEFFGSKL